MPVMITCGSCMNTRVLARLRDTAGLWSEVSGRPCLGEKTHETRRLLRLFTRIIESKRLRRFLHPIDNLFRVLLSQICYKMYDCSCE